MTELTKRGVLCKLVKVYDPLGLVSPLTLEGKLIFRACLHGVGDPGLVGLVSFVFTLWGTQKKPTPLDRGPPLHVNRVLEMFVMRSNPGMLR